MFAILLLYSFMAPVVSSQGMGTETPKDDGFNLLGSTDPQGWEHYHRYYFQKRT